MRKTLSERLDKFHPAPAYVGDMAYSDAQVHLALDQLEATESALKVVKGAVADNVDLLRSLGEENTKLKHENDKLMRGLERMNAIIGELR